MSAGAHIAVDAPHNSLSGNARLDHPRDLPTLSRELSARTGMPLRITLNANRRMLISFRPDPTLSNGLAVSLHHGFLAAGEAVLEAVARFLTHRETPPSRALLQKFMDAPLGETHEPIPDQRPTEGQIDLFTHPIGTQDARPRLDIRPEAIGQPENPKRAMPPAPDELMTQGRVHDLRRLADIVNYAYFDGRCPVHVTWGKPGEPRGRRRRSILFGSYSHREHLVRIHPRLDAPDVPEFFVQFVLYHEMLHKAEPPVYSASGRRQVHTAAFRKRERRFPQYRAAMAFERKILG